MDNTTTESSAPIPPPGATPGSYRRFEKVFKSSRSSNDTRGVRPNYAGNPLCINFIKQLNFWVSALREEFARTSGVFHDGLWADLNSFTAHGDNQGLEITINSTANPSGSKVRDTKPVSIRLPPYNYSIHLIQVLEDSIAHEQHFFRRKELRAKVWHMHQNPETVQSKDQGWLCHWLAVMALGELYNAVPGVSLEARPQAPTITISQWHFFRKWPRIRTFSTSGRYVCFACVSLRAALALKLHRDPSEQQSGGSSFSEIELEHRKRLFWTVYYQDLLTTCTTASPWGVLDDEITVGYGSSAASQSGDFLLEFTDAEEQNQHLELMRLRSQAYSSLYGYAGTAINPFSHVCLMDHDLEHPLTSQHLDKILEFYDSLVTWEAELPAALKMARSGDGSMMNLNRVNANLYLIYYQSILVLLRPALVMLFNHWFETRTRTSTIVPHSNSSDPESMQTRLLPIFSNTIHIATSSTTISAWLSQQGALPTYSYFHAHYLLTSTMALSICKTMSSAPSNDLLNIFTHEQQTTLADALSLLGNQAAAGNAPAREFKQQLELLDQNLQALDKHLHHHDRAHVFDLLVD